MRFKKILCALAAAVLCLSLSVTAYADAGMNGNYSYIMPLFDDDIKPRVSLVISGDSATCTCSASGDPSVIESISVVMTLQKSGLLGIYSDVKDAKWTKSVTGSSISLSGTKSGISSGTYRTKAVFTVTTNDGQSTTFTRYS